MLHYPADFTAELKGKPICGVLSVAIIAKVTFKQATDVIKRNLMPHQKRHGGKTYHEQRCNSLDTFGVKYIDHPVQGRITLKNFVPKPDTLYMITTTSHVVTVYNELVIDQYETNSIENHGSKRCFVKNILEIKND